MALKVELKPGERIIIGDSLIRNDNQRTRLFIEGSAPILREKDILRPEGADTPAKRIYLAVQLMYLSGSIDRVKDQYLQLIKDLIGAAPSTTPIIKEVSTYLATDEFYKALKSAKKLIEYEGLLLDHVQSSGASLSDNG